MGMARMLSRHSSHEIFNEMILFIFNTNLCFQKTTKKMSSQSTMTELPRSGKTYFITGGASGRVYFFFVVFIVLLLFFCSFVLLFSLLLRYQYCWQLSILCCICCNAGLGLATAELLHSQVFIFFSVDLLLINITRAHVG